MNIRKLKHQEGRMVLQTKKNFIRLICLFICMITLLQACSTGQSKRYDIEAIKDQTNSKSFMESQKTFADHNPTFVSRIGELELTVGMATLAEIPEDHSKIALLLSAEGAGSLALGLVAPPMYAGSLFVGGALLLPLGTYAYLKEKWIWNSINEALSSAEFTRAIDSAMRDRINKAFVEGKIPNANIKVTVQSFGLVASPDPLTHCFEVSANFMLSRDMKMIIQDYLQITNSYRSIDAPPSQCARLEHFAENEATLVKESIAEYAEVLAAMAVDRIKKGHTK